MEKEILREYLGSDWHKIYLCSYYSYMIHNLKRETALDANVGVIVYDYES